MRRHPQRARDTPAPADTLSCDAVMADLEQLAAVLPRAAVYTTEARSAARAAVRHLQAQAVAGALTRAQLLAGLARIAAAAQDGHTNLDFGQLGRTLPQLPMRFTWFADGLYVTAVSPGHADQLGSQIVQLEGRPPEEWLPRLSAVIGGTPDRVRTLSAPVLITPAFLQALDWAASASRLRLLLRSPDGSLAPVLVAVGDDVPTLTLAHPDGPLEPPDAGASVHLQELPGEVLYVGLRQIDSGTDGPLPQVLDQVLRRIRSARPQRLIIDLRGNGGGNYILSWPFTQQLREAVGQARVYALIDEGTFSAAIVTLAWLRHDAGARIIGCGPGDAERFYAEPVGLELASANTRVFLATQSHDWAQARHDFATCVWLNLLYAVPAGSLRPDVQVQRTWAEYTRGCDAALHAALVDDLPWAGSPDRPHPPTPPIMPDDQQVAACGLLLTTLGHRHGREEWLRLGSLIEQLSGLSVGELATLRAQNENVLGGSDADVVHMLRRCRAALMPRVIAYSLTYL